MNVVSPALRIMLFAALAMLPSAAFAQNSPYQLPSDTTLDILITQALEARAEIKAAEADIRVEQAQVSQVSAFADPTLQVGIQNDGFTSIQIGKMETSYLSIMASQTFPWPGKRQLRSDIATLEVKSAERAADRLRLSTEAAVRQLYINLLLVRDQQGVLRKLTTVWEKSSETARTVYEAGGGSQADVLRAQLELTRMKQRKVALLAQEATTIQSLNRLRGKPLTEPIATSATLASLGLPRLFDEKAALTDALTRSPEIAESQLAFQAAHKSKALAEKSYFPDLTVSAGVMPRGGNLPPMWLLSVSAPIPIFGGSKQAQAAKESDARAQSAQAIGLALKQELGLRAAERHTALKALLENIEIYNSGLLIQSRASAESALSQYRVGKASFASVLEANAGVLADEAAYLAILADAHQVLIAANEVSLASTNSSATGTSADAQMPTAGVTSRPTETKQTGASAGSAPMTGGM